ncbi:biopolymer transporter [Candidatus Gracilibacteria bacterium]|jgi:Tol biopolymer transport system component|nr:biopolymer transporter [Candidatus Gracilibacteria bacterium]NJM88685.1 biopolymer transporter [Hydrococcus sp. RU_2_2]NJP18677.1 biopolymer transporter [Hydrococcus sp. CRU_1_1]NJQ96900.1 biopolymer transporter [Hydrococcus sp. CSU_1_8]
MFSSRFLFFYLFLLPILTIGGCNSSLFVAPQIPVGDLNSQFPDESPAYSSDGKYLAFASDRNGNRDIYLLEIQQRRLIPLPNLNRRDSSQDQPALSADGRYIAYVSTERGRTDIMVYDQRTQRSELLSANVRGTVSHPTISGDGRKIAFQTSQFGQWNIAIVERNIE